MIRTAESITRCHPDKVCDQISDAILDACLSQDPLSRVAVEAVGGHGTVYIVGEITSTASVDIKEIVGRILTERRYPNVNVEINVVRQSSEIAAKVDNGGAGDQGIMIGYACNETPEMLPLEFKIARDMTDVMGERDGKSQVTVDDEKKKITAVASVCGADEEVWEQLKHILEMQSNAKGYECHFIANPGGDWTLGGFDADTGLTGRKIVADAYGPRVPVGGGAFSGKDPSKVDRSAAYMARRIACDAVRAGSPEATVRIAYAIGIAEPVEATIYLDGHEHPISGYDLTPAGIRTFLGLTQPIYEETARTGHFGRGRLWD